MSRPELSPYPGRIYYGREKELAILLDDLAMEARDHVFHIADYDIVFLATVLRYTADADDVPVYGINPALIQSMHDVKDWKA